MKARYQGQVEAMAIFTRRRLIRTSAPILSSLSRWCRRLPRQIACARARFGAMCRAVNRSGFAGGWLV